MSDFEDGQQLQRAHGAAGVRSSAALDAGHTVAASQFHPLTPLKEVPEQEEEEAEAGEEETAGARNNNSIIGKVRRRVSSILPAALSGWFSPSSKPGAESPASLHRQQQEQQRQPNGRTKRKRGRRRIVLAEADAEADDVDDGSDARGLDYEEVALADNIAEHDLAAEDEQTRRSEYNVFLLRRQRDALAAAAGQEDDDEDDDEEDEEEECDEEDDDDEQELQQVGLMPKRRRLELETTAVSLPHMRRLPLSSSTPAASLVAATSSPASDARNSSSQLAPHRRTHLNLYGNQRNREPAFNFFAGNEAAAEGTTGDLPHSIRRALNIPFGGGGGSSSSSNLSISSLLPNHKRPPLLAKRTERLDRIGDCAGGDRQRDLYNLLLNMNNADNKNINNNNNNNVEKVASGGGDSHSEGDLNNYQDNGEGGGLRPSSRHNSNSHLEFYGNLQSAKSLFNRNNVSAQPTLHNSTWSLNSLSKRRKFNASIYGSTSALSDSRLLSHSASGSSASASSSPFYQGRTAFGGHSANNRFFNRSSSAASSLLAINSGGSSPVHSGSGSFGYGMKPVEMRPNPSGISGSSTSGGQNCNLSSTTQRILHLLDSYSTPLIDAKRMGSTLKEHQSRRNLPAVASPYSRPQSNDTKNSSFSISNASSAALAELRSDKLLLPSMQQLLERRRLNRVTASSRNLMLSQRQNSEAKAAAAAAAATAAAGTTTTDSVPSAAAAPPSHSHHTNKMRSKLSHQTRGKETREEEAAPPPLDLPQISFPDMASTPKFDLVIKKTAPQPVVPASTSAPSKSNSSTSAKPNFLVNPQPQPLNVANGSVTGVVGKPAGRLYSFPEPTPLNPSNSSVAEPNAIRRTYFFPAPASLEAEPAMNGLPPQGFGEQFKKSGQEWECDVCMVRNKAEVGKCVACESPKPGAVSNVAKVPPHMAPAPAPAPPIGAGFGDRFKKSSSAWECDACMLSNKEEATKCIACETPRKTAAPKINNFPSLTTNNFGSVSGSGFGDAFKPKPGRWECQTCLVMNDSAAVECVACQTPNPQAQTDSTEPSSNSSSSSSSSGSGSSSASGGSPQAVSSVSSSSFKFGFAPKQDAGFQQLVAAQKAASWDCDACMAQNDMSRHKCICCEQLKPGSSASGAAISESTLNSSSSSSTLAAGNTVPKFSFGFAPVQKATTEQQPTKGGFTFGASKGEPAPEQTKEATKATTATSSSEVAAPVPAPALTQPFVFRAPTTSSTASSSTATTTTTSTPALAGFSFGAPSSSSTVSSSTANSVDAGLPAAKPMFSFSGTSAVSSTSSQQPAAKAETLSFGVSSNTITTTTSSTGFALTPAATPTPAAAQAAALSFGATPASATAPAPAAAPAPASAPTPAAAPAPAPAAANFSFGSQAAKTVSTPVAAGNFFFGQPPAAALGTVNTSVSSIFGASAVSTSTAASSTNSTVVSSAPAAVATSNPLLFSFGGGEKKAETTPAPSAAPKPFLFGSAAGTTTTTTPMPSFGWPSNGASSAVTSTAAAVSSSQGIMMAEQPIFASSAMFAAPSSTSSSLFGSTATTAAATPAAVSLGGNGGGLATVFGNVGNSLVAPVATAAATPAAIPAPAAPSPLANIFGNPTPIAAAAPSNVFGSAGGGFGGTAATTTATTKPAFNFSGSAAVAATPSGSPFNFGSSTAAPAKPTFNFTGSVTASTPQAGAFTFSANPSSTPLTAGDTAQPSPQRIFRFGAPSDGGAAADMGAGAVAGPGGAASSSSSSSSFAGGAPPPMFNFNAATPQMQMQSTPNANAPFQFSAGAPAPANIFAFNQPAGQSAQNSQVRRKVRTPMRRLPPR